MPRYVLAASLLAFTLASTALADEPAKPAMQPPPNMESYQLVLLRRGPSWTPEVTPEVMEIQKQHIAHLQAHGEAGHIVIAGPFGDQEDATLRGMCLYRVASLDEARRLASEDPAVKAGRLKVEVMTWWVEKGYMTFPKAPVTEPPQPKP